MDANAVKEYCSHVVGVINNFPMTQTSEQSEFGSSNVQEPPKFFKREAKNLILDGQHVTVPVGHTGLTAEVHFGVVIKDEVAHINTANALDYVDGYVAVLNTRIRHTDYDTEAKSVAETYEFPSDVAISAVIHKQLIDHPNIFVSVNNQEVMRIPLANMILSIEEILEKSHRLVSLTKGDIVLCGTPEGAPRIQAGDAVEIGIDGHVRAQFTVEKAVEKVPEATPGAAEARYVMQEEAKD